MRYLFHCVDAVPLRRSTSSPATLGSKAASNFLLLNSIDQNVPLHQHGASSCWEGLSRHHVVVPFEWLDPQIKSYLVREAVRCLLQPPRDAQLRHWGMNLWCDPSPCLSPGVGTAGDEINYRGTDLPLPNPFCSSMWIAFVSQFVIAQGTLSPFCRSNPCGRRHARRHLLHDSRKHTHIEWFARWSIGTYYAIRWDTNPCVIWMMWRECSHHSSLCCIFDSFEWWFSLWPGWQECIPPPIQFDCCVGT